MKSSHQPTTLILLSVVVALVVVTVIVTGAVRNTSSPSAQEGRVQTSDISDSSDNSAVTRTGQDTVYPLYLTTMTHMEGNWDFVLESEDAFLRQVERLEFGMDLAEDYEAMLTVETEEPFARANVKWNRNVMKEILERGHGVGSHCDRGSRGEGTYEELVEELALVKSLVDALVGQENNRGCSGAGGPTDWAQALVEAGFEYVNGVVGFHMLAFPLSERPDGWNDHAIYNEHYHDGVPVDLEESIHLFRLANTIDWEPDETGIVVSSGEFGQLTYLAEGDRETCIEEGCPLTEEDVEAAVEIILEAAELHDPSRVGKAAFYFPTSDFVEENEEVLRLFFSEMQRLEEDGVVQWGSQLDVYNTYLDWENAQ